MKGLLELAKLQTAATGGAEERGGWNGRGTLRGGWAAGKDLGEVVDDKPPVVEMPSSTDSDSSDESDGDEGRPPAPLEPLAAARSGEVREHKKRKREKEKKSKSEKSERPCA